MYLTNSYNWLKPTLTKTNKDSTKQIKSLQILKTSFFSGYMRKK